MQGCITKILLFWLITRDFFTSSPNIISLHTSFFCVKVVCGEIRLKYVPIQDAGAHSIFAYKDLTNTYEVLAP